MTMMDDLVKDFIANKDVEERCTTWIREQKDNIYTEENAAKRKLQEEYNEYYATDSEFDSVSECGAKRRRLGKQMKDEVLHLVCEWKDCTFTNSYLETFLKHVANHIPQLESRYHDDGNEVYICSWKDCAYESDNPEEICRHINYHAYHTKLKCIGTNIRGRVKLPKCHRDAEWKNIIDLVPPHICRWEECLKLFTNYQMFLYHVTAHVEICPRGNKIDGGVECKWTGCKGRYVSLYKLRDHMRCHTKEKVVACPDCGATFASNTKFHIHCKRQIPLDVQGFQCSYCTKFYPTEGILRDHMRFHVFNYKCTLCDMTCESPASLAKHVRYRHVSTRNFPCQLCSHAAKSQQDLDSHMTVHTNGPNFSCYFDGCLFTCKGAYTLDRHIERVHSMEIRWYCCHECPLKYRKSYRLTKHLIEVHHLQLPSGHKRFRYVQDEDGCYRLQMVRYESIDDENLEPIQERKLPEKKYKLKLQQTTAVVGVKIEEDIEDSSNGSDFQNDSTTEVNVGKSMPIISNILISIDDTDADGNIIKTKLIETQETNELPPSDEPPIILN